MMNDDVAFSRRAMLQRSGFGLGAIALNDLCSRDAIADSHLANSDLKMRGPHFPASAKSVILLFQNGGPSQVDLFDPKPELTRRHGESVAIRNAMNGNTEPLMSSPLKFRACGDSGTEFSELVPHLSETADDLCVVRSMYHLDPNHPGGTYMMCSCSRRPGRPTLGAWITYALGSETQNLPSFVCLRDPTVFHSGGSMQITSGWLPSLFRGTELRSEGDPVLNLRPPVELQAGTRDSAMRLLTQLNERHRKNYPRESELDARIQNYELAGRMQVAAEKEFDLSSETAETQRLYGLDDEVTAPYGRQCLLARRLVERGVRFVQILAPAPHNTWDHHDKIYDKLPHICRQVDRPSAALIQDLKRRGLLKDTIVLWAGEFGRMPISQRGHGRDHNPHGFSLLLAGGGFKTGCVYGATDELGYRAVQDRVGVPDLMATILNQLGLDHTKLGYQHHGVEETLTEARITGAKVIRGIIA
jgi:hypothetical protein